MFPYSSITGCYNCRNSVVPAWYFHIDQFLLRAVRINATNRSDTIIVIGRRTITRWRPCTRRRSATEKRTITRRRPGRAITRRRPHTRRITATEGRTITRDRPVIRISATRRRGRQWRIRNGMLTHCRRQFGGFWGHVIIINPFLRSIIAKTGIYMWCIRVSVHFLIEYRTILSAIHGYLSLCAT